MALNAWSKLTIVGIGFMMMIQNYSFFLAYWDIYLQLTSEEANSDTAWWLGFSAIVCAIETVFACGMMLGGLWDGPRVLFWTFWVLHAVVAVFGYTVAVIFLGRNLNNPDGQQLITTNPNAGNAAYVVWVVQVVFYFFYVACMLAMTGYSAFRQDNESYAVLEDIDNDKLVIFAIGLMMMIQNFSFAKTYWDLYTHLDLTHIDMYTGQKCRDVWWWLGYSAIVCAIEVLFACGMMLGGWFDSSKMWFWIFWILHAVDAVPGYTVAVIFLGKSLKAMENSGLECFANDSFAHAMNATWKTQVAFYFFYVACMLYITYLSAFKQKRRVGTFLPILR